MDSARTASQIAFKPLKQIYNARSDPQNVKSSISAGFVFYKSVFFNNKIIFFGKPGGLLKGSQNLRIFDLNTSKWGYVSVAGSSILADNKESYSVCVTSDGVVLCGHDLNNLVCVEKLSPTMFGYKWVQYLGKTSIQCYAHHSSNILGDKMYVFGGFAPPINHYTTGQFTNELYEYTFASKEWKKINQNQYKPDARQKHSTCLHKSKLFVFGGMNQSSYFNDIWSLDLQTFIWTKNSSMTRLAPPISGPTSIYTFQQNILIFGGTAANTDSNEIAFFNTDSEKWESTKLGTTIPPLGPSSSVLPLNNHEFIISDQCDLYKLSLDLPKVEVQKNEGSTLQKQMKELFDRGDDYDIIFRVEDQEIRAYKGILKSRSPYFTKMFAGGMKESQDKIIDVANVKYGVFRKLIEFIYYEEIEIGSLIASDLLKLSHEYSLPSLTQKCGRCLSQTIHNQNFLLLANLAETYQAEDLQAQLLNYFFRFKEQLLKMIRPQDLPRFLLEGYMATLS